MYGGLVKMLRTGRRQPLQFGTRPEAASGEREVKLRHSPESAPNFGFEAIGDGTVRL